MKTYMPLNGLRWSRNSGSANCDMPQSAVFGRPGGGNLHVSLCASRIKSERDNKYVRKFVTTDMSKYVFALSTPTWIGEKRA